MITPLAALRSRSSVKAADVVVYRDGEEAVAVDRFGNEIARSTDHAEVIQRAIDYIDSSGGGSIYIKRAKYNITKNIYLESKLRIISDGAILKTPSTLPNTANGILSDSNGAVQDVEIRGIVFDVNNTGINITRFYNGSENIKFVNCEFKNSPYVGINGDGVKRLKVYKSKFINVRSGVLVKNSTSYDVWVIRNEFTGEPFAYALSVQNGAHRVVFAFNTIHDVNRPGDVFSGVMLEDNYPTAERAYNIIIIGNKFYNLGWTDKNAIDGVGVAVGDSYNVVIANNVFSQCYKGAIDLANGYQVTVIGNILEEIWGDGITMSSGVKDGIIEGNIIINAGRIQDPATTTRGINLYGIGMIVIGNKIVGDGSYPQIGVEERSGADYNIVDGNLIEGVPTKTVKVGSHSFVQDVIYDATALPSDGFVIKGRPILAYDSDTDTYYLAMWNGSSWVKVQLS